MAYSLKDHVKGQVQFLWFRDNELWYITHLGLQFPVPLADTQGAIFNARDKGIFFMRWIKRYIKLLEDERGSS